MISINDWRNACVMLTQLRRICRPCMNHYIRQALCDLLKWIIEPLLPKQHGVPGQKKDVRRFAWGLAMLPAGEGPVQGHLRQAADLQDFAPACKQVLDHLEYYMHTDNILLTRMWQVLGLSLKEAPEGSNTAMAAASANSAAPSNRILDDRLVAIIYKHLGETWK